MTSRYRGRPVPDHCNTLLEVLAHRAETQPDRVGFRYLENGEREAGTLTYGELYARHLLVASALRDHDLVGKRVLLFYTPGLDFVSAFFGCLAAAATPIAVPPPLPTERTERIHAIVDDAAAAAMLTTSSLAPMLGFWLQQDARLAALPVVTTDALESRPGPLPTVRPDDLAFLQYTSGSTSQPRGVEIRHRNLMANLECIQGPIHLDGDSVSVTWLPIFHDMGLINGVLAPVYVGCVSVMMSPLDFIRRPERWLRAISSHRGTHSGGPNFAYDLCARKLGAEERAALDLSTWRQAYLSAEPIHADTLSRFEAAFAASGFRREAFYPCYGLAEATLAVTGGDLETPPVLFSVDARALEAGRVVAAPAGETGALTLVGNGVAGLDTEVVAVDVEARRRLPEGQIGEIWVRGPGVADGYLRRPEESAEQLRATLADGSGPFLRTGDLGFFRGPELFLVGRSKDVLIVRGRNYHPHDLEWAVGELHPALRAGCAAAFLVDESSEPRLVLCQETRQEPNLPSDEIIGTIRQTISEQFALQVHRVVLVGPGGIPRTSSGKIQRRRCRDQYSAGQLAAIAQG
jgi:acyl-CoA synthetase (AMP-forming)/AMP-acid ligase II